ncbi:MAG: HAD-IC family P-type ATPase, partial [Muribaculaceae bacterium]|nr:HAD-IC family P-type ATPase [Muribaculaceae bacterium]
KKNGTNILTPPKKLPLWKRFLEKFRDPLIIILMIAGVLSVGISCYEFWGLDEGAGVFFEPVGIFMAILLATGLAFIFELKADREFELLNQVNDDEPVQVIRSGYVMQIARKDVVVGDIVILNTGEEVPADGELLEAVVLGIDESTLTGEPICHKTTNPDEFDPDATFPGNHAMRGTKIMEGHGIMRVFAVGDKTENGKVFEAARIDDSVRTPLNEQLDRLGNLITRISYGFAIAIIIGRMAMFFVSMPDFDWVSLLAYFLQTLMIAVTLVVVAVPEGLPMAVTLSLAYSMRRMLKTSNLVRKMHACETMGAATVICTDKTGTLTQNQMQVAHADFFGAPSDILINEGIAVNSTAQLDFSGTKPQALGNPTEGALLLWLHKKGVDYLELKEKAPRIEELPFSTERKYMATMVKSATGKTVLYVKGAPEIIFGMCRHTPGTTR